MDGSDLLNQIQEYADALERREIYGPKSDIRTTIDDNNTKSQVISILKKRLKEKTKKDYIENYIKNQIGGEDRGSNSQFILLKQGMINEITPYSPGNKMPKAQDIVIKEESTDEENWFEKDEDAI